MYFAVSGPGGTNDITAYRQSELYAAVRNNQLPDWVHFMLDEAYASFGGIHLVPYSREELRKCKLRTMIYT